MANLFCTIVIHFKIQVYNVMCEQHELLYKPIEQTSSSGSILVAATNEKHML